MRRSGSSEWNSPPAERERGPEADTEITGTIGAGKTPLGPRTVLPGLKELLEEARWHQQTVAWYFSPEPLSVDVTFWGKLGPLSEQAPWISSLNTFKSLLLKDRASLRTQNT